MTELLEEFSKELQTRTGEYVQAVMDAIRTGGTEAKVQEFVRGLVDTALRPAVEAKRKAVAGNQDEFGVLGSRAALDVLDSVLVGLEGYPEAWKVVVDATTKVIRVDIPDRRMEIIGAKLDRGTAIVPKVAHFDRVRRLFAEEVSDQIARLKLSRHLEVVRD